MIHREIIRNLPIVVDIQHDQVGLFAHFQRTESVRPAESAGGLTDAEIEALIAERTAAKKARNFARADEIRKELASKGVILEDTKEGVRWKRQ